MLEPTVHAARFAWLLLFDVDAFPRLLAAFVWDPLAYPPIAVDFAALFVLDFAALFVLDLAVVAVE